MQNVTTETVLINDYLGYNRYDCLQALLAAGIDSIAFGHWLAIPSQSQLLVFRHQQCIAIDSYQSAA